MKSIGVFCGSSMGRNGVYKKHTAELGRLLAVKGIRLVYGGANIGLMKILADSTLEHGGYAIGVMPHILVSKEIAHTGLNEIHIVNSMHDRKTTITGLSDAFIALPGGLGTLDELAEILSWSQLEIVKKPLALFNIDGYFDHLIRYLDHCVSERFLRTEHRNNLIIDDDASRLLEKLETYKPVMVDSKWVDELKHIL
ncbi:MAG: TIGR00730 family Rossman fold protein [Bacteroidetes bacterium]|nr:TIGR00730 family Rossman fold protein [Bacteroidota bacterium]